MPRAPGTRTTAYPWGDEIAQRTGDRQLQRLRQPMGHQAAGAGRLVPVNPFDLHDMVGNVFEWIEDCSHSSYNDAPKDGSAWMTEAGATAHAAACAAVHGSTIQTTLRSAYRSVRFTVDRDTDLGFRVARTLLDTLNFVSLSLASLESDSSRALIVKHWLRCTC